MKLNTIVISLALAAAPAAAFAQGSVSSVDKWSWSENCGWMNWHDAGSPAGSQGPTFQPEFVSGFVWCENIGWINLGNGHPANGTVYTNTSGADFGVNWDQQTGTLNGMAWGENVGWINFNAGAQANPPHYAKIDYATMRLTGYVWGENIGWISLDDSTRFVGVTGFPPRCGTSDFDGDGDFGTDQDIQAFFACLGGDCCATCQTSDFNGDGDAGTDLDIQSFFSVLGGSGCLY